jgi:pimeloyl-ACP methyl ester carboxylesterase
LSALVKHYRNILVPLPEEARFEGPTLFVRGEKSAYVTDADWPEIRKHFPNAIKHLVAGAGHWVPAENPEEH